MSKILNQTISEQEIYKKNYFADKFKMNKETLSSKRIGKYKYK